MPIRVGASGVMVAGSFFAVTTLAADPPPRILARLDYRAPGGVCPAESALHTEVMVRLGYDPFTSDGPGRVVAHVERQRHTLSAKVTVFNGFGKDGWSKSFSVREGACSMLLSDMGSIIAYYLDPLVFSVEPSEPPPVLDAPPKVELPKVETPKVELPKVEPPKVKKEHRRLSFELGLGPQLAIGASGPAFSMIGHAGLRSSMLSLGMELRYDATRGVPGGALSGDARAGAYALGGSLAPCVHVSDFFGCALLSAGRIWIDTSGIDLTEEPSRSYFGAGPRLGFERRFLPWLGLRLYGEALFMAQAFELQTRGDSVGVASPLASRVNGAAGASVLTYFSP